MIPDEAVDAACDFLAGSNGGAFRPDGEFVRKVLEAAAPHIIREAKADAWDEAVASLVYEDGEDVEIISNDNPYRSHS